MDVYRRHDQQYSIHDLLRQEHYTPDELAHLLDMSASLIRREARAGRLHASIVEHQVLDIRREDVVRWLQERGELTPRSEHAS